MSASRWGHLPSPPTDKGLIVPATRSLMLAIGTGAIATLAPACGSSTEKVEAQQVMASIQALRDSDRRDTKRRAGLVDALAAHAPRDDAARAARDACVKAYRLGNRAQELIDSVEKVTQSAQKPGQAQLEELEEATTLLDQSVEVMPACDQAVTRLRVTHDL